MLQLLRPHIIPLLLVGAFTFALDGQGISYFALGGSATHASTISTNYFTTGAAVDDFNLDGVQDVVGVSSFLGTISLVFFRGLPSGGFAAPIASLAPPHTANCSYVPSAVDLNHDGIPDVLLTGGAGLFACLGNGGGLFSYFPFVFPIPINGIALGDLNGDGWTDFVGSDGSCFWPPVAPMVRTYFGSPTGFATGTAFAPGGVSQLRLADLDQDGILDVVMIPQSIQAIQVCRGLGGGTFAPPVTTMLSSMFARFSIADLNADGFLDVVALIVTSLPSGTSFGTIQLLAGGPGATLAMPVNLAPANTVETTGATTVFAADFDGDTTTDVVVCQFSGNSGSGLISHFRGDGTGSVAPPMITTMSAAGQPWWYAVDSEGDGDLDLLGCAAAQGPISATQVLNRSHIGTGCAGQSGFPQLGIGQALVGNSAFSLSLTGAAPNAPSLLALSAAVLPNVTGCGLGVDLTQLLSIAPAPLGYIILTTDALGNASLPAPIPAQPSLHGATAYAQWGVLDSAGTLSTLGLSFSLTRVRTVIVW